MTSLINSAQTAKCPKEGDICCAVQYVEKNESSVLEYSTEYENDLNCSDYAALGFSCVHKESCKTNSITIRALDLEIITYHDSQCTDKEMICCHEDNRYQMC